MNKQKGFTLIELMIVVAVIGILSVIIYPSYVDYVRRGQIPEATSALSEARIKYEQFFQDQYTYVGAGVFCPPNTAYFDFDCTAVAPRTYTIVANGNGNGNLSSFSYSINQANAKTTVITDSSLGWGTGGACWITKKGGVC